MATELPLQSADNSTAGGQKTIEQAYKKKTHTEHILLCPDIYIGSISKRTDVMWVYDNGEMVNRSISYVPALFKIFDEILLNAADNKQQDSTMDCIKVDIDRGNDSISVYNNGAGVPVEIHQEEGVYVAELMFGHLLTSRNYNDDVKRTMAGRNGYGAKLTNIFSKEFVIDTADGKRRYKQVFSENMGKKSEPSITECNTGENWTRVLFKPDLAKFNMIHLEDDVVALMKKRVIELAGTLGKGVKVELNGEQVPVKTFRDYVDLYINYANKSRDEDIPMITDKPNDRWEVCVSLSEGQFQQVSIVNGINTISGGTHVEHVTSQITNYVAAVVNKVNTDANVKARNVKDHLWVFINAHIENPVFNSQTKETLTSCDESFGSKCELSKNFFELVENNSGIVKALLSWAESKQNKELKKTDGSRKHNINIPKLEDAFEAGGVNSHKCTLILTEGDSAMALAMAGLSVVGRENYGVFPLKGKLLNVRDASHNEIKQNDEIRNLKQIIGLKQGKCYDSVEGLRYGSLMIMTDQDYDGSHIKGLLINLFHFFWPSLLKLKGFMTEFITPIVKASSMDGMVISFYTMPEYDEWKRKSMNDNARGWTAKYFKGLGTNTAEEGRQYFKDLVSHRKTFVWVDEHDGEAIELAFSKKKVEERKNWLLQFKVGTYLDHTEKEIKYSDFVNKELILYSMADLHRSIPSMVDGLKPGQRKILFCAFMCNLVNETGVSQFSGYVSEHSGYQHGEHSLANTIVGMAQNFVGSNNINLFQPKSQFGTRNKGGKDAASARYLKTCLSTITRFLFPKDDDFILDYLDEDGQSVEPAWYMPIIPMVLVNGSEGIGTGWSSSVPNYNPRNVVENVRRLLNDEPMQPMKPWYRGFKGLIEKSAENEAGVSYTTSGIIKVNKSSLIITELPIHKWTADYSSFLDSLTGRNKLAMEKKQQSDDAIVHFEICLSEDGMAAILEGLDCSDQLKNKNLFDLTTTIKTNNMHLFDSNGNIKKYDTPEKILQEFFQLRLQFYKKRKRIFLDNLESELLMHTNKVNFILGVVNGEIIVINRKRAELFHELHKKGFNPLPNKTKGIDGAVEGATNENEEESVETVEGVVVKEIDYEYLLSMSVESLTQEKVEVLCADKQKIENKLEELRSTLPEALWQRDLAALENQLDELERKDAEESKRQDEVRRRYVASAARAKLKSPRKSNAIKGSTTIATDAELDSTGAATTNTRKREEAQGKELLSHVNYVLKPDENVSPEKKVRKIRKSPFNKKSGSFLGRTGGSVVESEGPVPSLNLKILFGESGSEEEPEKEDG